LRIAEPPRQFANRVQRNRRTRGAVERAAFEIDE
jgi:hypothetical protein